MAKSIKNATRRVALLIHNHILRPNWKYAFISKLTPGSRVLDVGCGNDSPYRYKTMSPGIHYTGIDITNYNQNKPNLADKYIVVDPDKFDLEISKYDKYYDAIISSHNIEHCYDRNSTLNAMIHALKPGGRLYLAFPSSNTTQFPKRGGTLNYHDDDTHVDSPPDYDAICETLQAYGLSIEYSYRQYRPLIMRIIGSINESRSVRDNRVKMGTWEYYGFESIICASKPSK